MRIIPIDQSRIKTLTAGGTEAVLADDGSQKTNRDGQPLYRIAIVCLAEDGREPSTFQVRIAGQVPTLALLTEVTLKGLVARPWSMGDRSGITFSADSIEVVSKGRAA